MQEQQIKQGKSSTGSIKNKQDQQTEFDQLRKTSSNQKLHFTVNTPDFEGNIYAHRKWALTLV